MNILFAVNNIFILNSLIKSIVAPSNKNGKKPNFLPPVLFTKSFFLHILFKAVFVLQALKQKVSFVRPPIIMLSFLMLRLFWNIWLFCSAFNYGTSYGARSTELRSI